MYLQANPVEIEKPMHCKLIESSMTAQRLYYRPTVFFGHRGLIALSFLPGNFRREFQKYFLTDVSTVRVQRATCVPTPQEEKYFGSKPPTLHSTKHYLSGNVKNQQFSC
jgi:hypothetical protein